MGFKLHSIGAGRRRIIRRFIILLCALAVLYVLKRYTPHINAQDLRSRGPIGPLAIIALKILTAIVLPLVGTPINLAAGAVYGVWLGALYVTTGDLIGGILAFAIARYLVSRSRWFAVHSVNSSRIGTIYGRVGSWQGLSVLMLAFVPHKLLSYAAGAAPLPVWQFFTVSAVLLYPANLISVGAGSVISMPWTGRIIYAALAGTYLLLLYAARGRSTGASISRARFARRGETREAHEH